MSATIEKNLLFGTIALQLAVIDEKQFAEAAKLWNVDYKKTLADILVELKHLSLQDRANLDQIMERILKRHQNNARASLGNFASSPTWNLITSSLGPQARKALLNVSAPDSLLPTLVPTSDTSPPFSDEPKPSCLDEPFYDIIREHAEGGLGTILVVRDRRLNREVALKEIKTSLARKHQYAELKARFLREAQITGQLEHPNIVPVYELSQHPKSKEPFFTMRFIQGQTLGDAIKAYHLCKQTGQDNPVEFQRLLTAFLSICNAISYAHSRGVIHRDLKPANVILGHYGEVVVLDWGMAKQVPTNPTESGEIRPITLTEDANPLQTKGSFGSPAYMAPEQAGMRHDLICFQTDVYGLGVTLFEIVTGQIPYQGSAKEVMQEIATRETPRRAQSVDPLASKLLDAICAMAMAKNPLDRYLSAKELGDEIRRYLANEPIQAVNDLWSVKAQRRVKHNPSKAMLLALLSIALMLALTLTGLNRLQGNPKFESHIGVLTLPANSFLPFPMNN